MSKSKKPKNELLETKNPEKKTENIAKVDKRKTKLEQKECPICHEFFECRGLPVHLRKHDRENGNKKNVIKILKKYERLKNWQVNHCNFNTRQK